MSRDALGFVPRLRSAPEALELGLGLLQAHGRQVAVLWCLQTGLVLALALPFLGRAPVWVLLVLWWLKPWLDRGVLFVLSRAVFGQSATVWEFLREWRNVHRQGLAAGLLWRRFSPVRSFALPVFQLEGLGGPAYRARVQVLTRQGGGTALLLLCCCLLLTVLTFLGILGLASGMLPPGVRLHPWGPGPLPLGFQWLLLGLGVLVLTLTEPLFAAAGFGLYLNRRTQLEGWDLEQAFRRLAARLAPLLLLALWALPLGAQAPGPRRDPAPVEAPLPETGPLRPETEASQRVARVWKADPAFRHTREVRTLQYRPTGQEPRWLRALLDYLFDREEQPAAPEPSFKLPEKLLAGLALAGKILMVGGLLAFLLWLVYRCHHRFGRLPAPPEAWEAPTALAGLDIRPESLPPDVPAAARGLFLQGRARAALALLYRGALAALVHHRGLEIPASATEGDCLRAARTCLEPGPAAAFGALTATWQRLAYKDEAPAGEAFEALCAGWTRAFGGGR